MLKWRSQPSVTKQQQSCALHCFGFVLLLALLFSASRTALASSISFVGDLRTDANVLSCGTSCTLGAGNSDSDYAQYAAFVTSFVVSSTSTVQVVSFSYGGGVNGAGATIAQGGLEPYLSLFDSTGNFLASTYYGVTCPAGAHVNTDSGECYDVLLDAGNLLPGTYEIALTAYLNMSYAENLGVGTLADGFTGLGNLAFGEDLHYAFDVNLDSSVVPPTPVPEPATVTLLLTGLALLNKARKANGGSNEK